ncbi:hypothetical protein Tco_0086766 [Tanacetum coccineum]
MLQRFNMPTQTIPMLSKKPKKATNDLHKDILGTRNPGLGYMAKRAQPVLYDADTLLHPNHHPVSIWDSEEVLVHQVVSMKKMNEKPGHVRPANDFYAKLNALMFVPQKELSGDQAYWLSANEIASQASKSATPGTPFVHKSRPPSQVLASLRNVNAVFPQFEGIIKERTTQKPDYVSEWCYDYANLRQQLQREDDTSRNLDAQFNIMKVVEMEVPLCSIHTVIIDPNGIRAYGKVKAKEDHKVIEKKLLKQVKDQIKFSTSSYERHDQEHLSDTNVFTMKMEILLEPTSNKLLVKGGKRHPQSLQYAQSTKTYYLEKLKDFKDKVPANSEISFKMMP